MRDSSLSACTQAVIAAEVGHLELAYDYLGEAALIDLDDLEHNTRDGLHIASLAGAWIAAVAGFGGMRDHGGALSFAPRLPARAHSPGVRPRRFRGRRLRVEVEPTTRHLLAERGRSRSRSSITARRSRWPRTSRCSARSTTCPLARLRASRPAAHRPAAGDSAGARR